MSALLRYLIILMLVALALPLPALAQEPNQESPVQTVREVNPDDIQAPPGYRVELVATGLTYLTSIAFDDQGTMYVGEAGGHTYGSAPEAAPPAHPAHWRRRYRRGRLR